MIISIITCTKNSEGFVRDLLDSVITQNYKSIEHIFVDGYSNDKTTYFLNEYRKKANFPVKIYRRKPRGISDAMNFAVKKSKGDFLLFVQSNDCIYKNSLKNASKILNRRNVDFLIGRTIYINESGVKLGIRPNYIKFLILKLFPRFFIQLENFVPHPSTFIRRTIFNRNKYDLSLKYAMDYELWLKSFPDSKIHVCSLIFSLFRFHDGGVSSNPKNKIQFIQEEREIREKNVSNFILFLNRTVVYPIINRRLGVSIK